MKSDNTFSAPPLLFIVISVVTAISVLLFAVLFVFNPDSGIVKNEGKKTNETVNENKEIETEEDSEEAERLRALIAEYDEMLSSKYLLLVNKSNPLDSEYEIKTLVECSSNPAVKLDTQAEAAISAFIADASEAGYVCRVISGYRTYEEQNNEYNSYYQSLLNGGYTKTNAESMTNLVIAKAGESEYETGFTVDIAEKSSMTVEEMENSDLFKYAKENLYKYGFVLRYPQGKTNNTGYSYSPFCFRYVGFDGCENSVSGINNHAQYMYENNLSFEEYIDYLRMKRAEAVQSLNVLLANQ